MKTTAQTSRLVAFALFVLASFAVSAGTGEYRNLTAGGTLRPGVYGRIALKGPATPPPLIYPEPVVGSGKLVPAGTHPSYLYVPTGQVRKWKQSCTKWAACDEPVLFIRMADSPGRWGHWRLRREQFALHARD